MLFEPHSYKECLLYDLQKPSWHLKVIAVSKILLIVPFYISLKPTEFCLLLIDYSFILKLHVQHWYKSDFYI